MVIDATIVGEIDNKIVVSAMPNNLPSESERKIQIPHALIRNFAQEKKRLLTGATIYLKYMGNNKLTETDIYIASFDRDDLETNKIVTKKGLNNFEEFASRQDQWTYLKSRSNKSGIVPSTGMQSEELVPSKLSQMLKKLESHLPGSEKVDIENVTESDRIRNPQDYLR